MQIQIHENGSTDEPTIFYFNLHQASKGAEDANQILCRVSTIALVNKLVLCAWPLSGALEVLRLRLQNIVILWTSCNLFD